MSADGDVSQKENASKASYDGAATVLNDQVEVADEDIPMNLCTKPSDGKKRQDGQEKVSVCKIITYSKMIPSTQCLKCYGSGLRDVTRAKIKCK